MRSHHLTRWLAPRFVGYLWAILGTLAGSLLLSSIRNLFDLPNVAFLYVLGVVMVAVRFGRGPSVAAALASAACYAFVFVPPHFSLAITEPQNLLAALIMLIVALLVGHLTSRLHQLVDHANRRSQESASLYALARELSGLPTPEAVSDTAHRFLSDVFQATAVTLTQDMPTEGGRQTSIGPMSFGQLQVCVPLAATSGYLGELRFMGAAHLLDSPEAIAYLETAASVIAVALERSRFAEKARDTEVKHAAESLRSSILAALSHDLRTPLAALVGLAETASLDSCSVERQRRLLLGIRDKALTLNQQMSNLLDMARLSSGQLKLNRAWQPVEEVVGVTVQLARQQWRDRELTVDIPAGLPPVDIDAVLIERVLWNLVENAIKYSPVDTPVELSARLVSDQFEVAVCDSGPGIPPAQRERIFELFQRGRQESDVPGLGLGLNISRTIVEAHGGSLAYQERLGGGSCFRIHLPIGNPPSIETLEGIA